MCKWLPLLNVKNGNEQPYELRKPTVAALPIWLGGCKYDYPQFKREILRAYLVEFLNMALP
jgi:hypothetical protein